MEFKEKINGEKLIKRTNAYTRNPKETVTLTCTSAASASYQFLPERDYVTFGSLLTQFRLSVCRLSVTLVHPTQGAEPFGKISSPLCTLAIL